MAANPIKSNEIIQDNVFKPTIEQATALLIVSNELLKTFKEMASVTKSGLGGIKPNSFEGIKKVGEETQKVNLIYSESEKINKKILEQKTQLDSLMTKESKELAALNVQVAEQKRLNKENARISADQGKTYDSLSAKLNSLRKAYKDLAVVNQQGTTAAKSMKSEIDKLDSTLKKVDATVGQHQRNVGNYASALDGVGGSAGNAISALKGFITNPIGSAVALIGTAIVGLKSAFESTERGADLLQSGISKLSGTIDVLKINIGTKLADAWEKGFSAETFKTISKNIATFLINPLLGVHKMTQSIIQALKPSAEQQAAIDLAFQAGETLEDIQVKNATRIAKLDRQFQENRERLAEGNMLIGDRKVLLKETLALQDKIAAAKTEEAVQELYIISLQKKKYKDEKDVPHQLLLQEADARAKIDEIMADAAASKVKLTKQETALEKEENAKRVKDNEEANKRKLESDRYHSFESTSLHKRQTEAEKQHLIDIADARDKANSSQKSANEKAKKEREDQQKSVVAQAFNTTKDLIDKESEMKQKAIESDLQANQKRQDTLRQMAVNGAQDTKESLAYELRQQAELEAKRDRQIKKQIRQQQTLAILQAFASGNSKDASAIKNLGNISSYYDGTEDTGTANNPLDGNGGRIAILHDNERVLTKEQNKKAGNLSNEHAAEVLQAYNLGQLINPMQFDKMPMVSHVNDERQITELSAVKSELQNLRNDLKNRPVSTVQVNEVEKIATVITKTYLKEVHTQKRIGGLYGRN
jgi:hypothetical protein